MGLNTALDIMLRNGRGEPHSGFGVLDATSKIYGVVPALVTAVNDTKSSKRHMSGVVEVYFPWLQGKGDKNLINPWARVCMPNAGSGAGLYCMPQIGDEVIVGFEHGDPQFPYVIGSLWNGANNIPSPTTPADGQACSGSKGLKLETPDLGASSLSGDKGDNKVCFWKSRTGNLLALDDKGGTVRISERSGQSVIQLEGGEIKILQKKGDGIFVFAKDRIRFDCNNFEVYATNNISMSAGNNWGLKTDKGSISISAGGRFDGTSKASKAANGCTGIVWYTQRDMDVIASAGALNVGVTDKLLVKSGAQDVTFKATLKKVVVKTPKDLNVVSTGGKISVSGLTGINWDSSGAIKLDAGGMITCKSMCINLN